MLGSGSGSGTNRLCSQFVANDGLKQQVDRLWDAALAPNTRRVYNTAIKCFLTFMTISGMLPLSSPTTYPQVEETHLIYFVTHCQNALKLKFETIKLYLAGIRYHYLRAGQGDITNGAERLLYVLRGIKKSQNNGKTKRLPITTNILKDMCSLLSKGVFTPFLDLMMQCICKLAFFGFLRCGEITCRSQEAQPRFFTHIKDIHISEDNAYFKFKLKSSKTDPFRTGLDIIIHENSYLQPVATMRSYINLRYRIGATCESPLFIGNEHNITPLSRETFLSLLRELLERLGIYDTRYCGHSLRIGAATSAGAAGVQDHVIQTLGRWSSDCYTRYIRIDQNVIRKAQNEMGALTQFTSTQ